jgi:23S rRNA (adenine2503-C2)-methyltransferase
MNSAMVAPPSPAADRVAADARVDLIGCDRAELAELLALAGVPPAQRRMRVNQIWHWLYHRGATRFADMRNISKELQAELDRHFRVGRPAVARDLRSTDGTRKWLLACEDGQEIESVFIPETDRGTLCVSSQVGCTLTCRFCHTGTQRLVRNLESREVLGQLMLARDALGEWPSSDRQRLTNIVMMGMGEPLYNFESVAKALRIVMDGEGLGLSRRRITLSTSGVVPMMERCGAELGVNLAVSLHAVRDDLRDELVPLNRKYPIAELLDACRRYPGSNNARRITFEYVMLHGVNDSDADARELVRLVRGIPAKVNLIPFNPWPGSPYACSTPERIRRFADIVNDAGYASPVRQPRGRDIMAACGQLKSDSVRERRGGRPAAAAPVA